MYLKLLNTFNWLFLIILIKLFEDAYNALETNTCTKCPDNCEFCVSE